MSANLARWTVDEYRRDRRDIIELQRSVKCLHDSFERFAGKYTPYLDQIMANHQYWNRVREEVIKHTAKGLVWAVIAGFCLAVWHAAQDYIASLVSARTK